MITNDDCRCHDTECPRKETCQRFTRRYDKGEWISHCMSLCDVGDTCHFYWPEDEGEQ